jgi:hypothetical protein
MKNIISLKFLKIVLLLIITTSLKAQITEIVAIDSIKYKIGDKIKMGKAMNGLPEFSHMFQWSKDDVGTLQKVTSPSYDSIEIVSIKENTKIKDDYNVRCKRVISSDFYITYSITFNKAIESGEIVSKNSKYFVAPTSEQALEQIKKAKEKLDLGLITKDEYDKKVNELKKYIKD